MAAEDPGSQPPDIPDEVRALELRLGEFFRRNPRSEFQAEPGGAVISRPWSDSTIELWITPHEDELIDALNHLFLPPRLTAVWHVDSRDLEVIWGPIRTDLPLRQRAFEFLFRGRSFNCAFANASSRLLRIASCARFVAPPGSSKHRNLSSFQLIQHLEEDHPGEAARFVPTSFWIRNIEWNDQEALDLVQHVNFFMRYFDQRSPVVLIHEEESEEKPAEVPEQHPFGEFPPSIAARDLDPYLLSLWHGSVNAPDPFRRFLYLFQIIEYAAFYHLQDTVARRIRRVLGSPDVIARADTAVVQIIDALSEQRMQPDEQFRSVIREFVQPHAVWQEIAPNQVLFSKVTTFEGGFVLPAIARDDWSAEDFAAAWMPIYPDSIRRLRNALVHAREARMGAGIAPSTANYDRIRPWIGPLSITAMQVLLFRES